MTIDVPPGTRISFYLSKGSAVRGDKSAVQLQANDGASVDLVLQADTRFSGRLTDRNGKPVTGTCLDLKSVDTDSRNGSRAFDCTNKEGRFQMEMMPPGQYWLITEDVVKVDLLESKSTLYYPGVRTRELATKLTITEGRYAEPVEFKMPSEEKRYQITGHMQYADGTPVSGGAIVFTSERHGYTETTGTGSDGAFGLTILEGMDGRLTGFLPVMQQVLKSCPQFQVAPRESGMFRFLDANSIPLSGDSDRNQVKLQLTSPSCKIRQLR